MVTPLHLALMHGSSADCARVERGFQRGSNAYSHSEMLKKEGIHRSESDHHKKFSRIAGY